MTAVSRLAALIAEHVYYEWAVGPDDYCPCGASVTDSGYPAHLAEVIAAADDLAVVELPKPSDDDPLEWCDGSVVACPGFDRVRVYVENSRHTIAGATELAAAILAAAKAAEAVSDR